MRMSSERNSNSIVNIIPRTVYLTEANLDNTKLSLKIRTTEEEKPGSIRILFLPRRGISSEQMIEQTENIVVPAEFQSLYDVLSWNFLDDFKMFSLAPKGVSSYELKLAEGFGITSAEDLEYSLEKQFIRSDILYECYFLEILPKVKIN